MKISNKQFFIALRILCGVLLIGLLTDLVLSQLDGSLSRLVENHLLAYFCGGGLLIFALLRVNFFYYEDEWEVLHIRSYSLLFSSLQHQASTRYEFPKNKVHHFEYKSWGPFKSLIIYLEGQNELKKIKNFDLTFLTSRQVQYVLESLERISKQNRKRAKAQG